MTSPTAAANGGAGSDAERSSPLDAVGVSEVMPLGPFLVAEQNRHGRNEVDDLSSGKQVDVGPAVPTAVPVPAEGQGAPELHLRFYWITHGSTGPPGVLLGSIWGSISLIGGTGSPTGRKDTPIPA